MAIESKGDLRGGSSADEGSRVTNRAKTPAAAQVPFLLVSLWPKRILNKVFLEGRHYVGQGKKMLCPEMMYGMLWVVVLPVQIIFFPRPYALFKTEGATGRTSSSCILYTPFAAVVGASFVSRG